MPRTTSADICRLWQSQGMGRTQGKLLKDLWLRFTSTLHPVTRRFPLRVSYQADKSRTGPITQAHLFYASTNQRGVTVSDSGSDQPIDGVGGRTQCSSGEASFRCYPVAVAIPIRSVFRLAGVNLTIRFLVTQPRSYWAFPAVGSVASWASLSPR